MKNVIKCFSIYINARKQINFFLNLIQYTIIIRDGRGDRDEDDESPTAVQKRKTLDSGGDPTYEMACVRRYITGTESIGQFIENSRKMFLLQVNI